MPTQTQLSPPLVMPIPTLEVHLMPFHIKYSGPAAVSTYFLVKPDAKPSNEADDSSSGSSKIQELKRRFKAAFRGRRIKGLVVDVPEGYIGAVLQADNEKDPASVTLPKKRSRSKFFERRRATRQNPTLSVENEVEDNLNRETPEGDVDQTMTETKILRPIGQFNSITIWNPDVDIDETYDEYIRTLNGYQRLLAEVHRIEPIPPTDSA